MEEGKLTAIMKRKDEREEKEGERRRQEGINEKGRKIINIEDR